MVTATRVDYPPAGPRPWGPRSTHFPLRSGPSIQRLPSPGRGYFPEKKGRLETLREREKAPRASGTRGRPAARGSPQAGLPLPLEGGPRLGAEGVPALKDWRGTATTYCSFLLTRLEGSFCFLTFEEDDIWNSEGF